MAGLQSRTDRMTNQINTRCDFVRVVSIIFDINSIPSCLMRVKNWNAGKSDDVGIHVDKYYFSKFTLYFTIIYASSCVSLLSSQISLCD